MSPGFRRRPPARHADAQGAYAGPQVYDYNYPQADHNYPQGYADEYDYGPSDDWWEEGTGGMFSPVRVLLGLLVIGAGIAALYGMFVDRTLLQMPITVSGLAVLGLALVLLGFSSARGAASLGRRGYGGRALLAALFGGICVAAGAGSLAGAIVLGMLALSA